MSVEDAKAALADLEGKLSDALDRRDKILVATARAADKAAAIGGIGDQSAKIAEAHGESAKARQAVEHGAAPPRLVQLEIRAPDGRMLRQFHRSVDAARKALQSGYEITGEVIGSGVVSPVGPGAQSFMKALLTAHGDELMEFLAERGVVASDKTVIVLPENGREPRPS
jgi:hypothetical protein